jgi:hypothetical protein
MGEYRSGLRAVNQIAVPIFWLYIVVTDAGHHGLLIGCVEGHQQWTS